MTDVMMVKVLGEFSLLSGNNGGFGKSILVRELISVRPFNDALNAGRMKGCVFKFI
jgi:hypothetical protein